MTEYSVHGPYKIPVIKKHAGRSIGSSTDFWDNNQIAQIGNRCGVYVFGMRAGKGIVPYYVGKTTNSFANECFHPHKLVKYNEALTEYRSGRPVMFFLARPIKRGQIKKKEIKQLEDFIILIASTKNPGLLNIRSRKKPKWAIAGVIPGTQGQPSREAKKFKSMMNL